MTNRKENVKHLPKAATTWVSPKGTGRGRATQEWITESENQPNLTPQVEARMPQEEWGGRRLWAYVEARVCHPDMVSVQYLKGDLKRNLPRLLNLLAMEKSITPTNHGLNDVAKFLQNLINDEDEQVSLWAAACLLEILYQGSLQLNDDDILDLIKRLLAHLAKMAERFNPDQYEALIPYDMSVVGEDFDLEKAAHSLYIYLLQTVGSRNRGVAWILAEKASKQKAYVEVSKSLINTLLHADSGVFAQMNGEQRGGVVTEKAMRGMRMVGVYAFQAVLKCFDGYFDARLVVPLELLEELLISIGQGTMDVHEVDRSKEETPLSYLPPLSYEIAATVLEKRQKNLQEQVVQIMAGLLGNDNEVEKITRIARRSRCEDVNLYRIMYLLHRLSPAYVVPLLPLLKPGGTRERSFQHSPVGWYWYSQLLDLTDGHDQDLELEPVPETQEAINMMIDNQEQPIEALDESGESRESEFVEGNEMGTYNGGSIPESEGNEDEGNDDEMIVEEATLERNVDTCENPTENSQLENDTLQGMLRTWIAAFERELAKGPNVVFPKIKDKYILVCRCPQCVARGMGKAEKFKLIKEHYRDDNLVFDRYGWVSNDHALPEVKKARWVRNEIRRHLKSIKHLFPLYMVPFVARTKSEFDKENYDISQLKESVGRIKLTVKKPKKIRTRVRKTPSHEIILSIIRNRTAIANIIDKYREMNDGERVQLYEAMQKENDRNYDLVGSEDNDQPNFNLTLVTNITKHLKALDDIEDMKRAGKGTNDKVLTIALKTAEEEIRSYIAKKK